MIHFFDISRIRSCLYDLAMLPTNGLGLHRWRKWATSIPGSKILEVGIGTGLNIQYYSQASIIFAVDPSPEMLRRAVIRARRNGVTPNFCLGRAETLPFPTALFDAAAATLAFCSVDDQHKALSELYRVLKPAASIRLFEHVRLKDGIGARLQDIMTPKWRRVTGGCHLNRDTLAAVETVGFKITRLQSMLGGVFIAIEGFR